MKWSKRLACLISLLTFILILMGGLVHATGSSLACPDWPLCYGQVFPQMVGGVAIEHSHRLMASLVGLLTVLLAFTIVRSSMLSLKMKMVSLMLVLLVVLQGVLGGVTVIYQLPTAISTAHLGLSLVFLALVFFVAVQLGWTKEANQDIVIPRYFKRVTILIIGMLYSQIIIGALVKHTWSSLACLDIPFCMGSLWPTGATGQMKLQMVHRIYAMLVSAGIIYYHVLSLRTLKPHGKLKFVVIGLPILVIGQVALGFLSVTTQLNMFFAIAHLGVGALMLLGLVYIYANTFNFKSKLLYRL